MPEKITNTRFNESIEYYYKVLKKGYLKEVESASDPAYAKEYYKRVLFLENEYVPYQSVLFQELRFTYHHFNCLNTKTAYEKTFELLPQIKTVAKKRLSDAIKFQNGDQRIYLADWYSEQIESGNTDLSDLIRIESSVLEFTSENLTASLALSIAGQKLFREFKQEPEEPKKSTKYEHQFTRNEQILALCFLIRSFGINPYQACDRTKLAALFHLVMGVPYEKSSKIKDLCVYKGLKVVPQVVENDNLLLKYLQNIRVYFEEANFSQVVELIDKHIVICTSKSV